MRVITTRKYKDNFGERIALVYPYDPDTNRVMKTKLPFPEFKWDKEERAWSIQANAYVINKASEAMRDLGYDVTNVLKNCDTLSESQQNKSDCWTKVKGVRLYLHWPYIPDASLRDTVRLAVRSISGRKFHAEEKCWSIPVAQATTLHTVVEDSYPKLAQAILDNPDISEAVTDSIERVAMSSAAELAQDKLTEITDMLDQVLPEGLDLYPFQKVAVAFAEASNGRCLIGDEMGIGKTISALGYAAINPTDRPMVVVSPANVKYNWEKEVSKWLPNENIQVVNSGKDKIEMTDVVIINYDLMTKKKNELMSIAPRLLVLDEVHYLKNSGSKNKPVKRTVSTLELATLCPKVLALSGTAIASRPREFFNALNLMRPDQFPSFWNFAQRYCDPWHTGFGWDFDGASNTKELNERTRDLCIRRLKSEVLPELPPKTRTFLPVYLPKDARSPYDIAQEEWERRIDDHYLNGEPLPQGMMLNMLNDLRHICGRTKIPFAVNWIAEYSHQTGKPLVVFAHHRDVIKGIVDQLNAVKQYQNVRVDTITGSVSSKKRQEIVENFQDGQLDVLICNTIAAKEGITLTKADTVLFIEREWVPTDEEQAEDRVYRIGQESQHVHAVYLSCAGTIDEHFDRVVEAKREVVKAVLDGGNVEQRKGLVKELVKKLKQERGWKYEVEEI